MIAGTGVAVHDRVLTNCAHQANLRMIETVVERLGLPRDRVYVNVQRYGNTSAASIPVVLDEAASSGCLAPGSIEAMVGSAPA